MARRRGSGPPAGWFGSLEQLVNEWVEVQPTGAYSSAQAYVDHFNQNWGTTFSLADLGDAGSGSGGGDAGGDGGGGGTPTPNPDPAPPAAAPSPAEPPLPPPALPTPPPDYRSAEALLKQYFATLGLPDTLATWAFAQLREGFEPDTIFLMAQERPEWKQRFIGNERRKQKGLAVIDPGTYFALEADYSNILRNAGLPGGLYDNANDFADWIGNDVSVEEFGARVQIAVNRVGEAPQEIKDKLAQYYGIGSGELVSYVLDPTRGTEYIERRVRAAEVAGVAGMSGLGIDQARAEELAGLGIDRAAATAAYPDINEELRDQGSRSFLTEGSTQRMLEDVFFKQGLRDLSQDQTVSRRRRAAISAVRRAGGGPLVSSQGVTGLARE